MAWYQDRSFILALSILIQQHEGVPQYDIYNMDIYIYIYIYIYIVLWDSLMLLDQDRQSLITVRGGYKSKARGGGSEVSPVPNIVACFLYLLCNNV